MAIVTFPSNSSPLPAKQIKDRIEAPYEAFIHMKTFFKVIALCLGASISSPILTASAGDVQPAPLSQVNLFIGTANDYGQLSPGATVPFGMIQVAPDSDPRQHPGYDYEVPRISGFSINRLSGVGGQGCGGNVSLLPITDSTDVSLVKATERAVPGLYSVALSNGVQCRATATHRMAVEQFCFPEGSEPCLLLNPASSFDKLIECDFHPLSSTVGEGMVISKNTCGRGRYHLHYRFYADAPFEVATQADGKRRITFSTSAGSSIEVRIVVSTGLASELAVQSEGTVWSQPFDVLAAQAADEWQKVLATVEVQGGTPDQQTLFYTSLYRVFHSPFQVTDDDFTHFLGTDGAVHQTDFTYYSSWSLWDTYRTKFPLISLLQPERSSDIMQSLAVLYTTGKKDWSTDYECVPTVRTEHAIATLLDAHRAGIAVPNLRGAYPGMVEEVKRMPLKSPDQCLETAGDYWALGQLAADLGMTDDARRWHGRGEAIFDSIWPTHFMTIDSTYTLMRGNGLYQGTRWQYRWGAPMFLPRMEKLVGRRQLANELAAFFDQELYNQGNEPDIHVPFLFGRLGMPRQTGEVVRRLSREVATHRYGGNDAYPTPYVGCAFVNAPRGYCPEMDEDDGAMSAWYVFAAIGLYPTVVGEAQYDLFSPLFDDITVRAAARPLHIRTHGRTAVDQPVKRVTWNGRRLRKFRIPAQTLSQGGELVFWY